MPVTVVVKAGEINEPPTACQDINYVVWQKLKYNVK